MGRLNGDVLSPSAGRTPAATSARTNCDFHEASSVRKTPRLPDLSASPISPLRFSPTSVGCSRWGTRRGEGVTDSQQRAMCPACHTAIPVDPEWRLAQCPKCGGMITRMGEDSTYD